MLKVPVPPGFEFLTDGRVPPAIVVAAMLVVAVAVARFAIIHRQGVARAMSGAVLVLLGMVVATGLQWLGDDAALRRSIDTNSAGLVAHALIPGSGLACLDVVGNTEIEAACEKSLFASAESVATALAYVDAKISLLAVSAPLAARDASYEPSFERARRALEADRFGLVAHVLTTRGCTAADCGELKLMSNDKQVVANMKAQMFDRYVGTHVAAWHIASNAMASLPGLPPSEPPGAGRKFNYPSAASIPALSIMAPEPSLTPSKSAAVPPAEPKALAVAPAEPKPAAVLPAEPKPAAPSKRAAAKPPRHSARAVPVASAEPLSVLPPPPPLPQRAAPQTSGQH